MTNLNVFPVEETGAHIDEESEIPLSDVNSQTLWSMTDVTVTVGQKQEDLSTINEEDFHENYETEIPGTTKKKKSHKTRKASSMLILKWFASFVSFSLAIVFVHQSYSK